MNILITGASGFVGKAACSYFSSLGYTVTACSRQWDRDGEQSCLSASVKKVVVKSYYPPDFPSEALRGIDVVLHTAARAHILHKSTRDELVESFDVNLNQTLEFAKLASATGVRRFIFVSSIKACADSTLRNSPLSEEDNPAPCDYYGILKHKAELGLSRISKEAGIEVVIVRPPLVYGPGVKGNFRSIIYLLENRVPLPFASINDNLRSLVSIYNLVDFLALSATHPKAAGQVFFVSDQCDVSTAELLRRLGFALGFPALLIPVPRLVLKAFSILFNCSSCFQRLCGSLVVDSSKASRILGWRPPVTLDEGLRRCVDSAL